MTTTINASNSGSGGLVQTADASGVLALQTAGTTALTIDTSQNVGIGTTSPAVNLEVKGSSGQNIYVSYTGGSQLRLKSDSGDSGVGTTGATPLLFLINNAEKARIDTSGNVLVGTTGQIKSSKQSIYSGATNATTYNTASYQGGSVLTIQNQQTTSVSTSATVIATTGIYATLALVYGSDGTNRFQDLIMVGLATGTVNVINSFTVGGTPASRTYSQSASTYRLAMGSGTYTIQFSGLSQGD